MSALWNEQQADAEVINNLIKEIRRLIPMPLLQLQDGRVIRVEQYEVVSADELHTLLGETQAKAAELQSFLSAPTDSPAPTQPEIPAPDVAPVEAPAAPTDPNPVASEQAPVEQPPLQ